MVQSVNAELELIYEGSVKRVYARKDNRHHLWFYFTDDYSVFDWGKMPDTIVNKGLALTLLGAHFFELMEARGIATHFKRLVSPSGRTLTLSEAAASAEQVFMEVLRAEVNHPRNVEVLGQSIWAYPPVQEMASDAARLVPLEVVFRFGMPPGSSLKERLAIPGYAASIGFKSIPDDGAWFDAPVLEFFTKLEPKDRHLSLSEALAISGLTGEQFRELCALAQRAAGELFSIFKERGIELWDGKFEFVLKGDQLLLADSIGPDELRLLMSGVHLSKEIIRRAYRGSVWEKALKQAQETARERGVHDWKQICLVELKQEPLPLPHEFKTKVDQLYGALTNQLVGEQLLPGIPSLESLVDSLSR